MLSFTDLAREQEFAVAAVTCRDDHTAWSAPEVRDCHSIVLVRRGRFRRRVGNRVADVDPTLAYLGLPGEEERFAHPDGGDTCTWLSLTPPLWQQFGGPERLASPTVYVDARFDLLHRRLLLAAAGGDIGYAVTEELTGLLHAALRRAGSATEFGSVADRALVEAAREAIATGHPASAGLLPLAHHLGTSPYRLSRAFSRTLGASVTRYRNRVRVGWALDRLEQGTESLGQLAAELGFADQAHLTRTMRQHLGETPAAVKRHLSFLQSRTISTDRP
ncbi:MAG TPA: AraC family transcriptional regulator [Micromonosporaceae bacterium]|nr:AraC family transcriptional regulator [Micromonosporaceae bacterium]